ncbi:MAG: dienelactone hydrolase family protein [Alphaproteobacteria bacterium]|nr:dienelactone hydrolase family protein [Alphaproteobacteria bacterium]
MTDHNQKAVTRRGFAATALVGGFALAAGPLNAAAIVTPADGLDAGEVNIPVKGGAIPAYRARPEGKRDCPVVLVVQEIFGVHEHIKDICRRFAKLGYYAIAPSLYARYGDPGKYGMGSIKALVADIVSKVPDAEVMQDLDAAAAFAGGEGADNKRLGITGWCWGGRIVWLYAAHARSLRAGVAWYGPLTGEKNALRPVHPIDVAGTLKAPVLGLYGGLDHGITPGDIAAMRKALADAGKTDCRIDVFADAQHGFFADYRASYNAADAEIAWHRCLSWLNEHGAA